MKWNRSGFFTALFVSLWLVDSCSQRPPETRLDREKWENATLTGAYNTVGNRDPKWDKDARDALDAYAQRFTAPDDEQEMLSDMVGDDAENAVGEGCQDPMIRYLYVRFSSDVHGKPLAERQKLCQDAADHLEGSSYPAIRKFYANVYAAEMLWWDRNQSLGQQVAQHRQAAMADLAQAIQDKSMPEADGDTAASALFDLIQYDEQETTDAYNQIEAALAHRSGVATMADYIKGTYYINYAWLGRGFGWSNQVTKDGWRLFAERLKLARKALEDAWSRDPQDPQSPTLMITVVMGEGGDRSEMEKWFARAMQADPDNYAACSKKLVYLLPKWFGSRDDMLAFGRECVASTNWGGQVPLILVDAHSEFDDTLSGNDAREYWSSPDVWPDIQSAYEKFAQLNPDDTAFHYPYAWYALECGQTNAFVQQINLIRQNDVTFDYAYFGGQETFDQEWAQATRGTTSTNAATTSNAQ